MTARLRGHASQEEEIVNWPRLMLLSLVVATGTTPGDNRTLSLNGVLLREHRRQRGLSREQLSLRSAGSPHYVSESTLKRAESGRPVFAETARTIAALLGLDLSTLLLSQSEGLAPGIALAVLPFTTTTPDPFAKNVARGLFQDLTTRLSQCWFPVISIRTTKDSALEEPPSMIARALNVHHLLRGCIQVAGGQYRVTLTVLSRAGSIQFATQQTFTFGQELVVQDALVDRILPHLAGGLLDAERARLHDTKHTDLDAWGASVRGTHLFLRNNPADNRRARELLRGALHRDQRLVHTGFLLAATYQRDFINGWARAPAESQLEFFRAAKTLRERHGNHPLTDLCSAYVAVYEGKGPTAELFLNRAIEVAPNLDRAYCLLGQVLAMRGEPERALELLEVAGRLCPSDEDGSVALATSLTHFVAERYELAAHHAEVALASTHGAPGIAPLALVASLALGKRVERAREKLRSMNQTGVGPDIQRLTASTNPEIVGRFVAGLQQAGYPV